MMPANQRLARLGIAGPILVMLMGNTCTEVDVTDPRVRDTVTEINAAFQSGYRTVLDEIGTRQFALDPATAARAMAVTLEGLGFNILMREGDYYLSVTAAAPTPLDAGEWQQVLRADEPMLKSIAARHLGLKGNFAKFEAAGLNIDGTVTMIPIPSGVEISITMRMRQVADPPPESILPRRDYPPPTAVRIGYEKIWRSFEQQGMALAATSARNQPARP
jgi:hypothetical protein